MHKHIFIALFLLIPSAASAKEEYNTVWKIKVINSDKEYTYIPTASGKNIVATTCYQRGIFRSRSESGDWMEFVQIDCKTNINGKTSMFQSCYVDKPDSSYGAMSIDDLVLKFSIQVSCLTF